MAEATEEFYLSFKKRQTAMHEIANAKTGDGASDKEAIFHVKRELELVRDIRKRAQSDDLDPDFVEMLLWTAMSAGKDTQGKILSRDTFFPMDRPAESALVQQLEALTTNIAQSYDQYPDRSSGLGGLGSATREIIRRENELVQELSRQQNQRGVAIDLCCATGQSTQLLVDSGFETVLGIDKSRPMINIARARYGDKMFLHHDLQDGIPVQDGSTDFVISRFGAASALPNKVLDEVERVLRPGGSAFLSYYNANALCGKWWIPWRNSLSAMVNPRNDTLFVPSISETGEINVYTINAGVRTSDELRQSVVNAGLEVTNTWCSSPMWDDKPSMFFRNSDAVSVIREHERATDLAQPYLGQYLRLALCKKSHR